MFPFYRNKSFLVLEILQSLYFLYKREHVGNVLFVTLFFYNRNLLSYLQAQLLGIVILIEVIILHFLINTKSKIHKL